MNGSVAATRQELEATARAGLTALYARLHEAGCAAPREAEGQLIRPLLALAGAEALGAERDERFWAAVAAVQLAHEASLVHDDVVDGAATRRSVPTLAASRGVAAALIEGDHLLTTAYRLAATAASSSFTTAFAHAVERTVAGEKLQGRSSGIHLDERAYRGIVGMKSGELLGCALAAAPLVRDDPRAGEWYVLGRRIGTLYQMLDDLLDYCPAADAGKPVLGDFAQQRWTWPLMELPGIEFSCSREELVQRMTSADRTGTAPLQRCIQRFRREVESVRGAVAACMPHDCTLHDLTSTWLHRAEAAVAETVEAARQAALRASLERSVAGTVDLSAFFRRNSRSFSFAANLFPPAVRARVSGVYAFCRVTDDLADGEDENLSATDRLARLDLWEQLARSAYDGIPTGLPLVDSVMGDAARARVPFAFIEELIEGMRMDLRNEQYATMEELRTYSYRVAGVVGQWLTCMCGVRDAAVLQRAADLGHAMQLTNILRDVGEDLRAGRVYIPQQTLLAFGITPAQLQSCMQDGGLPPRYPELVEHLMQRADRDYASALGAVSALPHYFRHAVVVAAHVYRGIHDAIRANGYDNLRLRAQSTLPAKLRLAARAFARPGLQHAPHTSSATDHATMAAVAPDAPAPARVAVAEPLVQRAVARRGASAALLLCAALLGAAPAAGQAGGPGNAAALHAGASLQASGPAPSTAPVHANGPVQGGGPAPSNAPAPSSGPVQPGARVPTDGRQQQPRTPAAWARELAAAHAAAPHDPAIALDLARALFFVAVDSSAAVERARQALNVVQRSPDFAQQHRALLLAYDGALSMLEAKHGSWPHARLLAVRRGLDRLDRAVDAAPAHPEIRYLRAVNTYYMPRFLGRRDGAREDLRALAAMLPQAELPPPLHRVIVQFVSANAG